MEIHIGFLILLIVVTMFTTLITGVIYLKTSCNKYSDKFYNLKEKSFYASSLILISSLIMLLFVIYA